MTAPTPLLPAVLQRLPAPVVRIDSNGFIVGLSAECEQLFEVHAADILGSPATWLLEACSERFLVPNEAQMLCLAAASWAVGVQGHRLPARSSTGESLQLSINSFFSGAPDNYELAIVLEDLGAQSANIAQSAQNATRFQTLTRLAPVGILELDANWSCKYANDKWCELSRLGIEESLGDGWVDSMHPADVSETLIALHDAVGNLESRDHELRLQTPLGENTWVSMTATGLFDRSQRVKGILVVATDITERYRANEELRRMALQDTLTGINNREAFLQALRKATSTSAPVRELGVLFLDLDGFKAVNDTLGHHAGDALLKEVAQRLTQHVGPDDTVARLGGDEFTILLPRHQVKACADRVAGNIVADLQKPFLIDGQQVRISASIGISVGSCHSCDEDTFIQRADVALYRAKRSGRAQHVFYIPELDRARSDHSALLSRLSGALDEGEFVLHYQPQVDTKTGRLTGMEALLRWPSSDFPDATTEDYINALEDNGLIGPVGDWVFKQACKDWRGWCDAGLIDSDVRLSVNVSARQLSGRTFLSRFSDQLREVGVPPERIVVEITESTAISTRESGVIEGLKDLGVNISIDDFGTGFSSLAYLVRLPADEIKIDKSFIAAMLSGERAKPLVTGILALAQSLGLSTVAEGVEDVSTRRELAAAGCTSYQGYLYSEPLSAKDFTAFMAKRVEAPAARETEELALVSLA